MAAPSHEAEDLALFHGMHLRESHSPNLRPVTELSGLLFPAKMNGVDDLLTADSDKNDYDWLVTPPGTPLFSSLHSSPHKPRPLTALKPSQLAMTMDQSSRLPTSTSIFPGSSNGLNRLPSSFPVTRATSRQRSATGRASIPAVTAKSASLSRPSTPTKRPVTPILRSNNPPGHLPPRSSSVGKTYSPSSRNATLSRGSSPTTRAHPGQPSAMPGFSLDALPNLRVIVPERSPSNKRGSSVSSRPGAPTANRTFQPQMVDANDRSRHQSFSPSTTRGRLLPGSHSRDPSYPRNGRTTSPAMEITVPVVMGSKISEKIMRARSTSYAQEDHTNSASLLPMNHSVKSTATSMKDASGFGRNLSKKSLDMALRHMDICGSSPNGFRPLITSIPASSLYSVRSATVTRTRLDTSAADVPVATCSKVSSEYNMSIVQEQEDDELGDEACNEKGRKVSPFRQRDSIFKDVRISNAIQCPDYTDDSVELMQIFRDGFEKLSGSESPLVLQNGEVFASSG